MIRNIRVTTAPENTERLAEMAVALANSGRIAFFSHHFLWDIGRHLQSKMIRMDRYVELYLDYTQQLACAAACRNDLAIVCTVGEATPCVTLPSGTG